MLFFHFERACIGLSTLAHGSELQGESNEINILKFALENIRQIFKPDFALWNYKTLIAVIFMHENIEYLWSCILQETRFPLNIIFF